jgi:NitT/TauT family transport system substrate-binding protein
LRTIRVGGGVAAVAVGVTVALLASGCGGSSSSGSKLEKTNLVVGAVPGEGAASLYIAEDKGLFAKQGLHVKIVPTTTAGAVIPELLHGTVDIDSGQWSSVIAAQAQGLGHFHALANGFSLGPHVHEILTLKTSGITSPQQLKGKTIAVNALNSLTTDLALTGLSAYGIMASDVHFVAIPFPAMIAALAAHRIDAAYMIEPYITEAEQTIGAGAVIDMDQGSTSNFPINGFAVTSQWESQNPKTAAAFATAISQGNNLAATNPGVLQQVLTGSLHINKTIAAAMASGTFPTSVDATQLQRVADLMLRYGQLKQRFSVTTITG